MRVAICQYGAGNVRSVELALRRLGATVVDDVEGADLAVLPGVGSARTALAGLKQRGHDTALREVILSGGDPLILNDATFANLVARIDKIAHVTRLRIHTRLPVVIPRRVTAALLERLSSTRLAVAVVLHVNHANEIAGELPDALAALRSAGLTILNQSVLLRGVNDDADALVALSETLFTHGVLPYYLHLPDRVAGTAHFDVSTECGAELIDQIARRLPGYLVPRLARETPGLPYKEIIIPA